MHKLIISVAILGLAFIPTATVIGQGGLSEGFDAAEEAATDAELSVAEPEQFIKDVINSVLSFVGLIAAAVIIWGGILYITSTGDEDKAAQAKRLILYAVVGLLLIGVAALIVNIVISAFQGT